MTLDRIVSDLRERRLWPLAAALLVAIVAVPLVLAKTPTPIPTPPPPPAFLAAARSVHLSLPSVHLSSTPAFSALHATPHDPFIPPSHPTTVTTTSTTKSTKSTKSTSVTSNASKTTTSASGGSQTSAPPAGGGTSSPPPVTKIPAGHGRPAPSGLTPEQTYEVTLAATDGAGGLNTTAGLLRLSPVPTPEHPQLVELGVLKGGQRVLFAVLPGTRPVGPGSCTPGPVDCEVLSLGVNQIETVFQPSTGAPGTEFAVTGIAVGAHPSAAAAHKARTRVSTAGRGLLGAAGLNALSLFSYDPSQGAVVDLRDLSAGGN